MINAGLLQESWAFALEHPEQYNQDAWGFKTPTSETHDIAGLALKLLGASFVWRPIADYPPQLVAEHIQGAQDIVFTSLPGKVCRDIVAHVLKFKKDRYADYFWSAVTWDQCPIGLAARIALGIDDADALVLFEEDAKTGEIEAKIQELLIRGAKQWKQAQDELPAGDVDQTDYLTACLGARGVPVTVVHA